MSSTELTMAEVESEMTKSQDMDCDHYRHVLTNGTIVEKIDVIRAPRVVEHLSTAVECPTTTSNSDLENHTQVNNDVLEAKRMKAREKKKRTKANQRKRKELARNSSTLDDVTSPSTLGMQESSTKTSSLEPSDQAPASAHVEELTGEVVEHLSAPGECSSASAIKDLKGHVEVNNNLETREMQYKKSRKKKRKLTSDSSLPSLEDIRGNSAEGSSLEVSNQVPVSAPTKELMVEAVEHLSDPGDCPAASSSKDLEGHTQVDNNSETKETKSKKRKKKKRKLTSDSSLPSLEDIRGNSAEGSSLEVSNQVPVSAPTKELMVEAVEHLSDPGDCLAASSSKDLEGHTQVDNNSETKETKSKKRKKKKRKLTSDSSLPSLEDIRGNSAEGSSLEVSNQVPVSAPTKELMVEAVEHLSDPGDCPAASSSKDLEGHTQVDNNLETKETKSKKRKKKKRKLTSDSSLPSLEDIRGNSTEGSSLVVSNQVPVSAPTKELMVEAVEHLSDPGDCPAASSSKDLEGHTQVDNNLETKETKSKKRKKKKRKLTSDSSLPSLEDIRGNSAEGSSLVVSNQVPVSAPTKELMVEAVEHLSDPGDCPAASSSKDLEGHTQVDNNLETKETKSKKRKKKKRKLTSDSSLPSTEGICGNSAESAHAKELMGEVVSLHDTSFLTKQIDLYPVGEPAAGDKEKEIKTDIFEKSVEENGILYDASLKYISDKCSGQFDKSKLNAESGTLNMEPMSQDGVIISSELRETSDDEDVNPPEIATQVPQLASLGAHSGNLRKKLLVLDINGILTDIVNYASEEYTPDMILSRKAVFKRPFCDDFLQFCFDKFDVGIWSSRTMKNVKTAVDFLMGELQTKLLFCWDQSQCTNTGFNTLENREKPMLLKELKKLWEKHEPGLPWEKGEYNESNTLLLDDSPYKALRNPPYTAIFPVAYCYKNIKDNSLGPGGDLRAYLEGLASADDVQKYVEANPFGQRAITTGNASWNFYSKVILDTSLPTRKGFNYQSSRKESGLQQRRI